MSAASQPFSDVVVERVGPIVVKEVRQGLRARVFAIFFSLLLVACLVLAIIAWGEGRAERGIAVGDDFLTAYLVVLGLVSFFVIPFVAFRSMVREREDETWVLLALTNLGPRNIVHGKWLSAMSQAMLFASACAPFVVFSYFLNGVDLPQVLLALGLTFAWTCFLVAGALAVATQANTRVGRTASHLVVLALLLAATAGGLGFLGMLAHEGSRVMRDDAFLAACATMAVVFLGGAVLCLEGAAAGLSLPTQPASKGPRLALLGLVLALLTLGLVGVLGWGGHRGVAGVGSVGTSLLLVTAGVFAIGEKDGAPRSCSRMGAILRPGALRSYLLVLGLLALCTMVWGAVYAMETSGADASLRERNTLFAGPLYVALYLSAAAFLSRATPLLKLGEAVGSRVTFLVVTGVGILLPPFLAVIADERANNRPLNYLNPFIGMINFADRLSRSQGETGLVLLGAATLLFVFLAWVALKARDGERHL